MAKAIHPHRMTQPLDQSIEHPVFAAPGAGRGQPRRQRRVFQPRVSTPEFVDQHSKCVEVALGAFAAARRAIPFGRGRDGHRVVGRSDRVVIGQHPSALQLEEIGGFDIAMHQAALMQELQGPHDRQRRFGRRHGRSRSHQARGQRRVMFELRERGILRIGQGQFFPSHAIHRLHSVVEHGHQSRLDREALE